MNVKKMIDSIPVKKETETINEITSFTGKYDFLSLTYSNPIIYDGIKYTNAMSAWCAQKTNDIGAKRKFSRLSGIKAKAKGVDKPIIDWEENKGRILYNILKVKFSDQSLKAKLKNTGNCTLINNISYMDEYLGVHCGKGKNILGIFLTKIRSSI